MEQRDSLTPTNIRQRAVDPGKCQFDDNVPRLLQRIYAARGVTHQDDLRLNLSELATPGHLRGLPEALALLTDTFTNNLSILVIGDFDADGATSTALMVLALRAMGHERVDFLVPNRFEFGYGLTPEIVQLAHGRRPDLLITVDNGISSHAGVNAAKESGLQVLITDHHLPGAELPLADAIVNPQQPGCNFVDKNLAGVGVVFYLMSALRARLREEGWFVRNKLSEPNMAQWLDLVALGTVADLVPLSKLNRILVQQGLLRIRAGSTRPGIQAMIELSNRNQTHLTATDLGFVVGPRLNAAGRLDDMSIGINCLLADNAAEARRLAVQLDELNRDRRSIEGHMRRDAEKIVAEMVVDQEKMPWGLCLMDPHWHEGVVGLVASRIKDKVHRPVIAFAYSNISGATSADAIHHNGAVTKQQSVELKGSARSIQGLHIRDVLDTIAATNPGLVNRFGGHAMAAGLSLAANKFARFSEAFDREVRRRLTIDKLQSETLTDGELEDEEFTLAMARQLRDGGPWGQGFPEPSFTGIFNLVACRIIGDKHFKFSLSTLTNRNVLIDAIAFGDAENYAIEQLPSQIEIVYKLAVNHFRGRESMQLIVDKIVLPKGENGANHDKRVLDEE